MRALSFSVLVWGILAVACLFPMPAVGQTDLQPSGTIAVDATVASDAAIADRIQTILAQLEGYDDVTVQVSAGIVTLLGTTLDAGRAERLNELVGRIEGVVAIENSVSETTDVGQRLHPAFERFQDRIAQLIAFLPLASVALTAFLTVVALGWFVARLHAPWDRLAPNAFIADILRMLVRLTFLIGGIVVALDILNATALLSTILGAAGIVGLAIGFAVRDTVENFIASIMLSIRQPFRPNDTIEIGGDLGKVIRLTSRATILLSFDGNHIRIPNATVFKSRIVNYSTNPERRFVFDVGVAPDTDLAQAVTLAQEVLEGMPFVIAQPAPNVWIETIGESTITLRLTAWILQGETSFVAARGAAIRDVLARFHAAGIEMPEPTYRVAGLVNARADLPQEARPRNLPKQDLGTSSELHVDARMEHELEAIVQEERAISHGNDLLAAQAPKE